MTFIAPTQNSAKDLIRRGLDRPVTMLNLLKFRPTADYGHAPELAPDAPISGEAAFARYTAGIAPLLRKSGGEILYQGRGGTWFIGPESEGWDQVLLVRQNSVADFLAFADDPEAKRIGAHRTAALADSRLLPTEPL